MAHVRTRPVARDPSVAMDISAVERATDAFAAGSFALSLAALEAQAQYEALDLTLVASRGSTSMGPRSRGSGSGASGSGVSGPANLASGESASRVERARGSSSKGVKSKVSSTASLRA